jgi:hypothetical protein
MQVGPLNFHHRQVVKAMLICREAIGRTEAHSEVAMEDQTE